MSFRVEGQSFAEWVEKMEGDLRYLYKCCEGGLGGSWTVIASNSSYDWSGDGYSEVWTSELGTARLVEVFASGVAGAGGTVSVTHSGLGVVASLTLVGLTGEVALNPTVVFNPGERLQVLTPSGGGVSGLTVQLLFEGDVRASGGLNIYRGEAPA
ncbi:MAG TPA: hypothetical protein VMW08_00135 [Acidimicrobiales bacterium]|nr:hypothetical protein [Acidimicrobiales bacterium]